MGIPDYLTHPLRNVYATQEAIVRNLHVTKYWFRIEKGVPEGCLLSPSLFNLYAEHIIRNVGLDEWQAEIKIYGRKINNLRHLNDTIYHSNGRKWRGTKTPLDEGERGEWKADLNVQFSSVQFSHSVVSDYLRPHESQHPMNRSTWPTCPSPTPGVHSNARP